jgi:uncharacterized protein YceK
MRKYLLLLIIIFAILLSGCGSANPGSSAAAQAAEGFYRALVERDEDRLVSYTCADYEEMAYLEYDSFQGVATELDGVSCRETGEEDGAALVECSGKIVATYGNEQMDFTLEGRVHRMVNEGGDWRMCGY